MTPIPITRAGTLLGYVQALRAIGAPVDAGLRRAKLPTLFAENLDAWISFARMQQFVADMACREGVPDLGIRAEPPSLDQVVTRIFFDRLFASPTLHSALQQLPDLASLQTSHIRLWTESRGDEVRFCVRMPLPPGTDGHTVTEIRALVQMEQVVAAYAGPDFAPTRKLVSCRRDDLHFDLESACGGVPVLYEQPYGAIEFPASLLSLPRKPFLAPAKKPKRADPPDTLVETLTACIEPYLLEGCPTIYDAADLMGLSVRSLQRALAAEELPYRYLVDNLRFSKALAALRSDDTEITALALSLGYSDETAFSRAFRRRTGVSPSAYRRSAAESTTTS
jgi:AraC-like DNA-binding protein